MDHPNSTHSEGAAHPAYLEQSRVSSIIACNVILLAVITVAVAVRLFVRYQYFKVRSDDVLCFTSWVFTFVLCFVAMWMTRYGYGRHFELIAQHPSTISMFLKLVFVSKLVYIIALNTIKMSFCVLYMHIFVPSRVLKSLCIALIVLLIMECIEEMIVVILQCRPVQKAWDATGSIHGQCLNITAFYYASFGIKLATDIAIFVLPIPPLLRLRVSGPQKFVVVLMFALGLLYGDPFELLQSLY
ncbi:putative integral membrane protein [Aspergillus thermomutatus]|uniref:Rhodopsin domain-containing protein n=1 Tax=Aspergillus thermomutatus TaxID=41047 RepID=A0A397HYN9_ASPTH|nr:uncharacterized protein CDV56_104407 [Aspergillus thermomutatus]RHZ67128.1 hypothetical protein CDV56_104407 [Aspergillus thermomutatus]